MVILRGLLLDLLGKMWKKNGLACQYLKKTMTKALPFDRARQSHKGTKLVPHFRLIPEAESELVPLESEEQFAETFLPWYGLCHPCQ